MRCIVDGRVYDTDGADKVCRVEAGGTVDSLYRFGPGPLARRVPAETFYLAVAEDNRGAHSVEALGLWDAADWYAKAAPHDGAGFAAEFGIRSVTFADVYDWLDVLEKAAMLACWLGVWGVYILLGVPEDWKLIGCVFAFAISSLSIILASMTVLESCKGGILLGNDGLPVVKGDGSRRSRRRNGGVMDGRNGGSKRGR